MHHRSLILHRTASRLDVVDRFCCRHPHRAELCLHFAESCAVRRVASHDFVAESDGRRIEIGLDPALDCTLYEGSTEPRFGWRSPAFGVVVPTSTLVGRGTVDGTTRLTTRIQAHS